MTWIRMAVAGVILAGLAAFRLHAGTEPAPANAAVSSPRPPSLRVVTEVPEATRATDTGAPAESTSPVDASSTQNPPGAATGGGSEGADPERRAGTDGGDRASLDATADRDESDEDDRDRRRRRRWRRNRYPGPIPSPEDWERPEGPVRIGLQAGHWRADEAPRELSGLRGGGTRWGRLHEWEVNLGIARRAGAVLEGMGYEVDILPAVVPPGYRAHLFISIHADGSNDAAASGYRVAHPRRDATGRAARAAEVLERSYGAATGLPRIPTVTRRMRNYYAFNFRRYEHALHPMTIAVIIETGFLTSGRDRRVIVDDPDRAARGIVEAVRAYPVTSPPDRAETPEGSEPHQPSDPSRPVKGSR